MDNKDENDKVEQELKIPAPVTIMSIAPMNTIVSKTQKLLIVDDEPYN